ncbi:MAG: 4Fe-4S dicluster domain-containing protein [Syntrophobacterales bacterium]|jgi:tetrathionate reductase subunit B
MKKQLAMVIDSSTCIDCKGCMTACKVENKVPAGNWRNWIKQEDPDFENLYHLENTGSMHFQPGNCMHCDNPTCVQACPTSATYKSEKDGTVKVNDKLCIGCGSCIPACPYGARYRHPEKKIVDKCDFCERRRARGELPACVVTCPTKARNFGDLKDPNSEVARLLRGNNTVRVVNRETDTKPNIYYMSVTAPINWPVKAEIPSAIQLWKVINPFVWGFVGLNALGVLAMLGKQLLIKDETPELEHKEKKEDPHE